MRPQIGCSGGRSRGSGAFNRTATQQKQDEWEAEDLPNNLKACHDATKLHHNVASRHKTEDIIVFLVATQHFGPVLLRREQARHIARYLVRDRV